MKIKDAKWEMAADEIGMRPKFRVFCQDCMWHYFEDLLKVGACDWKTAMEKVFDAMVRGYFDMPLREACCTKLPAIGNKAYANNMHYKCCRSTGCDCLKVFGVPIDEDYYNILVARRNGVSRIQPWKEWDADADLKKQLEGLGYI